MIPTQADCRIGKFCRFVDRASCQSVWVHQQPFVATIAVMQIGIQLVRLSTYLANGALPLSLVPLAVLVCAIAIAATYLAQPVLDATGTARYRTLVDLLPLCIVTWLVSSTVLVWR